MITPASRLVSLLLLLLAGCGHVPVEEEASVPVRESMVRTADEAVRIAVRYLREAGQADKHDFDAAEAYEQPGSWEVLIPYRTDSRPSGSMIVVSKRDASARLRLLR